MMLLSLALSYTGFTALSLSMDKHQQELNGSDRCSPERMRLWAWLGWATLTAAFGLCVWNHGWALGPVLWLGALTAAGLLIAFGLYPYRPRWIVPLALALPMMGVIAALL